MSSHAHVTGRWHDLSKLSPDGPLFQHSNLLIYLPVPITRCTSPCALDLLLQSIYKNADLTIPYSRGVCLPSPGRHGRTYAALREKARDGMTCLQGITRHLEGCSVADGGQATSAGSDNNCTSQINLKVSRNETLYRHEDERLCLTSPDRCARGLREPPDRPKQPLARPEFDD